VIEVRCEKCGKLLASLEVGSKGNIICPRCKTENTVNVSSNQPEKRKPQDLVKVI
jgi:phage FluMu protein Com